MSPESVSFAIVQLLGGLGMLYFGGEWLIRGASGLAARIGISPLAIGLTVVAFGTSAPELVVSVGAALSGANDISVGNVVGSNIANVAFILGLAAMLRPAIVKAKIVRIDAPIMILASLFLVGALANGQASRVEGGLLILGLLMYLAYTFWEARRESAEVRKEFASAAPAPAASATVRSSLMFAAAGLGLLAVGGNLLVASAVKLATTMGVSQATIGLTVVAVGTSLPELATSVIASARGQGDIAIGNVVGSNIFNIMGILGITAVIQPLAIGAISWIDLGTMVGLACLVTFFLYTRLELGRIEGTILVVGYIGYLAWLIAW